MCKLKLWICCTLLFHSVVQCKKENIIRMPLYKETPYNNYPEFFANREYYTNVLAFFFGAPQQIPVAKIDKNVDYHLSLQLGSNTTQRLSLYLDTCFSGLWVCSVRSSGCGRKNLYDRGASMDYERDILDDKPQVRSIIYNKRPNEKIEKISGLDGITGFDTLVVDDKFVHATHFLEGLALSDDPFSDVRTGGVFGLGFLTPRLRMAPLLSTLLDRGVLDSPEFSLFVGKKSENGELLLGGRNKKLYDEKTLKFHSIASDTRQWEITALTILINNYDLCTLTCKVLVDPGSALIAAPMRSLVAIIEAVGLDFTSDIYLKVQCDRRHTLPTLQFFLDDQVVQLSGYDYTLQVDENSCVLAFIICPVDSYWILGNVFLSKVYTVFNVGERKIGFANLTIG